MPHSLTELIRAKQTPPSLFDRLFARYPLPMLGGMLLLVLWYSGHQQLVSDVGCLLLLWGPFALGALVRAALPHPAAHPSLALWDYLRPTPHLALVRAFTDAAYRVPIQIGTGLVMVLVVAFVVMRQNAAGSITTRQTTSTAYGSATWMTRSRARELYTPPRRWPTVSGVLAVLLMPLEPLPSFLLDMRDWAVRQRGQRRRSIPSVLPLGDYDGVPIVLSQTQQEQMVLLVAPTGAGKTSRIVARGLLNETGNRSVFVPDPKRELWAMSAGYLASQGMTVWRFDPAHPDASHTYNPLAFIRSERDAQRFARTFLLNTGGMDARNGFWNNAAMSFIKAAVLHLKVTEPGAPLLRLVEYFTRMTLSELLQEIGQSPSADARQAMRVVAAALVDNPRVMGGVALDLAGRFDLLKTEEMARVTATNDLDLARMTHEPIALYLSIGARDAEVFGFLSACLIEQMFTQFIAEAEEQPTGTLPTAVMCYLDEFTNQGTIPQMSTYVSTLRSARVGLLIVTQSYAQIVQRYDKATLDTIRENCNHQITLPGAGQEVTEYLSRRIGKTTERTEVETTSRDGTGPARVTHALSEHTRALVSPEEIRQMPTGMLLIVPSQYPPLLTWTRPYYQVPRERQRATLPPPVVPSAPMLATVRGTQILGLGTRDRDDEDIGEIPE